MVGFVGGVQRAPRQLASSLRLLRACMHPSTCRLWSHAGHFTILSHKEKGLPLVAFSLNDTVEKDGKHHKRNYSEYDIADRLRMHHWYATTSLQCIM